MQNITKVFKAIDRHFDDVTIDVITIRTVGELQELDIKFKKAEPEIHYKINDDNHIDTLNHLMKCRTGRYSCKEPNESNGPSTDTELSQYQYKCEDCSGLFSSSKPKKKCHDCRTKETSGLKANSKDLCFIEPCKYESFKGLYCAFHGDYNDPEVITELDRTGIKYKRVKTCIEPECNLRPEDPLNDYCDEHTTKPTKKIPCANSKCPNLITEAQKKHAPYCSPECWQIDNAVTIKTCKHIHCDEPVDGQTGYCFAHKHEKHHIYECNVCNSTVHRIAKNCWNCNTNLINQTHIVDTEKKEELNKTLKPSDVIPVYITKTCKTDQCTNPVVKSSSYCIAHKPKKKRYRFKCKECNKEYNKTTRPGFCSNTCSSKYKDTLEV